LRPGSSAPAMKASMAPPPVETKLNFFKVFSFIRKAVVSPPPTILKASLSTMAAMISREPVANFFFSTSPSGPAQIMVAAPSSAFL